MDMSYQSAMNCANVKRSDDKLKPQTKWLDENMVGAKDTILCVVFLTNIFLLLCASFFCCLCKICNTYVAQNDKQKLNFDHDLLMEMFECVKQRSSSFTHIFLSTKIAMCNERLVQKRGDILCSHCNCGFLSKQRQIMFCFQKLWLDRFKEFLVATWSLHFAGFKFRRWRLIFFYWLGEFLGLIRVLLFYLFFSLCLMFCILWNQKKTEKFR